uniref:Uncharacterized protein n=1 Tax=Phaseolus vulgaris TaxID=3885 RepID=V7AI14_PHAVU|nr:hypothetical protein PHAVU_011G164300g [Phaseolus vulgaris]ESW05242.1 hypothetical protein PHAVU_011G164300g [Phaseolus vulgaris]
MRGGLTLLHFTAVGENDSPKGNMLKLWLPMEQQERLYKAAARKSSCWLTLFVLLQFYPNIQGSRMIVDGAMTVLQLPRINKSGDF